MKKNKTVVLGMSGGVDSSVAAYLLKEQGYNVIGVTMQIWQNDDVCNIQDDGGCCGLSAVEDARRVAEKLEIPFYVMNFREEFKNNVIDYFVDEYTKGLTPNPCIACNRFVKWESFLKKSISIGADYIATGHYAKIIELENGRYGLHKSVTAKKDQTYALYNLTQEHLKRTLMPAGDYTKEEIREIAQKIGLDVANKPDSQEICFIPDGDVVKFIEKSCDKINKKGNFIDKDGNILGEHQGIYRYTIGQRKGLGIAFGKPMYIINIDAETLDITLGDNEDLFCDELKANKINFVSAESFEKDKFYDVKIRYSHKPAKAKIDIIDDVLHINFEEPQRAITKGQAVVVYDKDLILVGGTIIA